MRAHQTINAVAAISLVLTGCGASSTDDFAGATCAELSDVMLRWAQEDLAQIESWPIEDQTALLADVDRLQTRAELVYIHTVFSRLGDDSCGAQELYTTWCDRVEDLSAGSRVGRVVRARMIESQCAA